MKKIKTFIYIICCFGCAHNGLFSQNPLNITIYGDSISSTIFSQDKISVHLDYSDNTGIQYSQRQSGIEIDLGNGNWHFYKDQLTYSDDDVSNVNHGIVEFINLPGIFCRDTILFDCIKNTGGELRLRFRFFCSIDSMPFSYHYSLVKKIILPPATSDDIKALQFLTEDGIDCDFFFLAPSISRRN